MRFSFLVQMRETTAIRAVLPRSLRILLKFDYCSLFRPRPRQPRAGQEPKRALIEHVGRTRHDRKRHKTQYDEGGSLLPPDKWPFLEKHEHERDREGRKPDQAKLGQEPHGCRMD